MIFWEMASKVASRYICPLAAAAYIAYDRSLASDGLSDSKTTLGRKRKIPTATVGSSRSASELSGVERWLGLTTLSKFDSSRADCDSVGVGGIEPPADEYPYFSHWHRSLMRKHLSREVFDDLNGKTTTNGYTINDVVKSGTACGYSLPRNMGCMAGDYEVRIYCQGQSGGEKRGGSEATTAGG